jgi:hypothetical protein
LSGKLAATARQHPAPRVCHSADMNTPTRVVVSGTPEAEPPPKERQETIEALLATSPRLAVPIRNCFVQQGQRGAARPGPLATFLTNRDERALDAYLLVHALASAEPWNCDFPSGVWVRSLGLADDRNFNDARGTVSKIMRRLCDRKLLSRGRVRQRSSITLLCEDGSGNPYRHPYETGELWLKLPYTYWRDQHYIRLSLRAKTVLLIALSLPTTFYLPQDKAPSWVRHLRRLGRPWSSRTSEGRDLAPLQSMDRCSPFRYWLHTSNHLQA